MDGSESGNDIRASAVINDSFLEESYLSYDEKEEDEEYIFKWKMSRKRYA